MNKGYIYTVLLIILGGISHTSHSAAYPDNTARTVMHRAALPHDAAASEKRIPFSYTDTPLTAVINDIAAAKGVNVLLPQGADAIQQKVTISFAEPLTLSHAEDMLLMLLSMSGYTVSYGDDLALLVKKTPNNFGRLPVPIYINADPESLPRNDSTIRAIVFLKTMRVPAAGQEGGSTITKILQEVIPDKNAILFDTRSNAVIVNGPANAVASALTIIKEIDSFGTRETVEVVRIRNRPASEVAKLITEQIVPVNKDQPTTQMPVGADAGFYFAPNTRVVAEGRTNSVILIGKSAEISKLIDFIQEHVDVPQDSGGAPLIRVYNLQYLNAQDAADTLKKIIAREGQQVRKEKDASSAERSLDGVQVVYERTEQAKAIAPDGTAVKTTLRIGGNRLVVTATRAQHEIVSKLIRDLDKIGRQVIVEVMLIDLSINNNKVIASQLRNPNTTPLSDNLAFQSAQFGPIVLNPAPSASGQVTSTNTTLAGDLLTLLNSVPPRSIINNDPNRAAANIGSTFITFSDGTENGIWTFLQFLDDFGERNIISHPYLVLKNNVQGIISDTQYRRGPGDLVSAQSVSPTTKFRDYKAILAVKVTPRIASLERLSLEIEISINDFVNPSSVTDFTTNTRTVSTNVNMRSGDLLVIGGLMRNETQASVSKVPLLGDLPIVGTFFRRNGKIKRETSLLIVLCPTIVEPKLRLGLNRYTDDKISEKQCESNDSMFASIQDPITRWYFGLKDTQPMAQDYLEEARYDQQEEELRQIAYLKNYDPKQLQAVIATEQNPFTAQSGA